MIVIKEYPNNEKEPHISKYHSSQEWNYNTWHLSLMPKTSHFLFFLFWPHFFFGHIRPFSIFDRFTSNCMYDYFFLKNIACTTTYLFKSSILNNMIHIDVFRWSGSLVQLFKVWEPNNFTHLVFQTIIALPRIFIINPLTNTKQIPLRDLFKLITTRRNRKTN